MRRAPSYKLQGKTLCLTCIRGISPVLNCSICSNDFNIMKLTQLHSFKGNIICPWCYQKQKVYTQGQCKICQKTGLVYKIDSLCQTCHKKYGGKKIRVCKSCGVQVGILFKGLCQSCYSKEYYMKAPKPYIDTCGGCYKKRVLNAEYGLCKACLKYYTKEGLVESGKSIYER